ncbi:MAG: hypothetical protein KC543_10200, partial [Myxococcales bacterium]|nr:hypothetical protein [Myxococcales bacterium]
PPTDACAAGTGLAHAQAAALAERLIASVRVGRAGGGRHAVHLRLHPLGPALEGLDVRLASVGDRIEAVVVGEHGAAAEHFAALFERACAARGVCLDAIEVQTR